MNQKLFFNKSGDKQNQKGQSIVILAFVMVGLIAAVGIAVDVGLIFTRMSQLQAGVDAAALAGVTELTGGTINDADIKAVQFLNANGVPITSTASIISARSETTLGATEYALTATWPVELFFLRIISRDLVNISKSATAAYFPMADIYASRRIEDGTLATSNQSVFGPQICTGYGDAFSPLNSPWAPGYYSYEYRIYIPPDYPDDTLRVELFDPDSINTPTNSYTIFHTDLAIALGKPLIEPDDFVCGGKDAENRPYGGSPKQKNNCLLITREIDLLGSQVLPDSTPIEVEIDHINPYWFVRVDENRGTGKSAENPNGNGNCGGPSNYDPDYNTQTLYELFYYRSNSDGTIERISLASYTGQVNDGARDNGTHNTDMRWVSPGADISFGFDFDSPGVDVPVDPGSQKTFELNISQDLPNIATDPSSGSRYVYLNVTALSGASENGFEIWAGPNYAATSPSDVNSRNLQVLNDPGSHNSKGVTIFGMGRLPMNSNFSNAVDIPLIYVGPEMADQTIFISLFDSDAGAQPPITFFFDSIAQSDWSMTFGAGGTDPDGVSNRNCVPGSCQNVWITPKYRITVPGNLDNCDWANPTQDDCTPFYGGRLTANYIGGMSDTYSWQINVTGLPYLVK